MTVKKRNIRTNTVSHPDYLLLGAVIVLSGLGLIMVLSASGVMAERFWGDSHYFFKKQLVFTVLGLVILGACLRVRMEFFYSLVYFFVIAAVIFLALTLSPLGVEAGGASRWLKVGPVSFQPLELAKVALVFYLASFFSRKQEMVKTFSVGFLPPVLVTSMLCILLIMQPDLGGAVFMAVLLFLMSMVGGTRLIYLASSMAFSGGLFTYLIVQSPYRFKRWFAFLDPFKDAYDSGYQLVQSMYGLGSGGWFGLGLGSGRQKLFFLPDAHNDFILSVLGEELGFAGMTLVFLCLAIIIWRAFGIALRQRDLQDRFTGLGMALILAVGALLNAAVVLGAIPPKGVPMPFLSYGGSNLIVSFFCVGILLNLSCRER